MEVFRCSFSCSLLVSPIVSALFPNNMHVFEFSFVNPSLSAFCYLFILFILFHLLAFWFLLNRCGFDNCFVWAEEMAQ